MPTAAELRDAIEAAAPVTPPESDEPIEALMAAPAPIVATGEGEISPTQLDEYLATTTARLSPYIGEHTEGFFGTASPDDIDDLFALVQLYVTEPRVTQAAADEQVQELRTRRTRAENLPASIAEFAMWDAYYQNSPWYRFIATTQQIDAATPDSLLDLYRARLGDVDDLVVVIVGDTDQDAVAELAARYIGTLPAGEPDSYIDHNPGFPPGIQRITIPVDADAGASGLDVLFGAKVPVTAETLVIADVISGLIDDLLVDAVREQLGETFAADISVTPYIEVGTWEIRISATGASHALGTQSRRDHRDPRWADRCRPHTRRSRPSQVSRTRQLPARQQQRDHRPAAAPPPHLPRRPRRHALTDAPSTLRGHRRRRRATHATAVRPRQPNRGLPHRGVRNS